MNQIKTKILIASSDATFIKENIKFLKNTYHVQIANSPEATVFLVKEWGPQIMIMDGDSLILNSLYQLRTLMPFEKMGIIVLSSSSNFHKEEKAFREGADDFLETRISLKKLNLKIYSLFRRVSLNQNSHSDAELKQHLSQSTDSLTDEKKIIPFFDIKIYVKDFLIKRQDQIISVTPTQFKILVAFISHPNQLLSRQWLKENIWKNTDISYRSIDAQISKLKKQIPELESYLINIYGKGYVLNPPQELVAS